MNDKQFRLTNGNILYVKYIKDNYYEFYYYCDEDLLTSGGITANDYNILLREIMGYLNINENEIKKMKLISEEKLDFPIKSKVVEI